MDVASIARTNVDPDTQMVLKKDDCDEGSFATDDQISSCIDTVVIIENESGSVGENCIQSQNKRSQVTSLSLSPSSTSLSALLKTETKPSRIEICAGDDILHSEEHNHNNSRSGASISTNGEDSVNSEGSSSLSSSPSSPRSRRAVESEINGEDNRNRNTVTSAESSGDLSSSENRRSSGVWKEIVDDFDSSRGGDHKILRAIGRTATVNAVVTATAALGPIAAVAGYATGGAITAKRLVGDGIAKDNPKEVAKSLAVFGSATSASLAGQAITGALAVGVLGASLPIAGALAFGAGCVSGITAGALSEWGVDGVMKEGDCKDDENQDQTDDLMGKEVPIPSTDNEKSETKNNFVDACGAWVNRQRERRRQSKIQREKTTGTFDTAVSKALKEKSSIDVVPSVEPTQSSSTVNGLSKDHSPD